MFEYVEVFTTVQWSNEPLPYLTEQIVLLGLRGSRIATPIQQKIQGAS